MSVHNSIRKPDIVFKKSGRVNISSRVSIILDLHEGDIFDLYFDADTKELYAYVYLTRQNSTNTDTRFTNVVKDTNGTCNYKRIQSISLTSFVLKLVNADEARLTCGSPKPMVISGKQCIALPVIWRNNLFNRQ